MLRLAADWPGSVQTTPLLHTKTNSHSQPDAGGGGGGVLSPSKSEHQYDVPWSHLLPRKPLGVTGGGGGGEDNVEGGNDYSDI